MNILYDATDIIVGQINNTYRTGVYFCAYNILNTLKNHAHIRIYLYNYNVHRHFIPFSNKLGILRGLKFINIKDSCYYKKNIKFHLNSIEKPKNFISKLVILLKIIWNFLHTVFINDNRVNLRLKKIDAILSPFNSFPEIIYKHTIKRFRLLHDVTPIIYPDYFLLGDSSLWRESMLNSLDHDTYYFCNSECTKMDFLKYFGQSIDQNKITVTYISSANLFKPEYNQHSAQLIADKYHIKINNFKYIFSFCTFEPRKNLIFTVKCFIQFIIKNNINDLYFLLGGEQWGGYAKHFEETFIDLPQNYQSKIIRLGYVKDSDVNMLYSNALFSVFLSQYEGFGMPVLEAMQAGTPVIAANNSSLPEVTGNAALSIDYNDEEACVKAMETLYFNESLRREYITKGLERAKQFSWENTVNLMVNKIREVIPA